jgi:hypothetical protein
MSSADIGLKYGLTRWFYSSYSLLSVAKRSYEILIKSTNYPLFSVPTSYFSHPIEKFI